VVLVIAIIYPPLPQLLKFPTDSQLLFRQKLSTKQEFSQFKSTWKEFPILLLLTIRFPSTISTVWAHLTLPGTNYSTIKLQITQFGLCSWKKFGLN
jgi:hypothetical protein